MRAALSSYSDWLQNIGSDVKDSSSRSAQVCASLPTRLLVPAFHHSFHHSLHPCASTGCMHIGPATILISSVVYLSKLTMTALQLSCPVGWAHDPLDRGSYLQ